MRLQDLLLETTKFVVILYQFPNGASFIPRISNFVKCCIKLGSDYTPFLLKCPIASHMQPGTETQMDAGDGLLALVVSDWLIPSVCARHAHAHYE